MVLDIHSTDQALTLAAAARELGRSRNTLVLWALSGKIPARKVPGVGYLTTRAALDAFKTAHPDLVRSAAVPTGAR